MLSYFLKGKLEELYFANPSAVPKEGPLEDQLLVYAFSGSKDKEEIARSRSRTFGIVAETYTTCFCMWKQHTIVNTV